MLDYQKIVACLILATIPVSIFNLVMHFYVEGIVSFVIVTFLAIRVIILKYYFSDIVVSIYKNIAKSYFR